MALLHRAELHPTKLELLAAWLPTRHWYREEPSAALVRVASCRFDDPAGAVGVEIMLVRADGPTYQTPLTYRGAPLDGGDPWLIGTTDHSVLGKRWVYDACGDPVYIKALAQAIFTGGGQAEEFLEADGQVARHEPTLRVAGSGGPEADISGVGTPHRVVDNDPTLIVTSAIELTVFRCLDGTNASAGPSLTGVWSGQPTPLPLAYASLR